MRRATTTCWRKMVATGLRKFPYMNARLTEDAILHLKAINMGMAVDTERGLLVPVIRDADQKSLRQFGLEFRELVERARQRKSLPDDLTGGTFTITSLGAFGIDAFTPVINSARSGHPGRGAHRAARHRGRRAARRAHDVHPVAGLRPPPGGRRSGSALPGLPERDHRRALSLAE